MLFLKFKLQNRIRPVMTEFILFHDLTLIIVLFILSFIIGISYGLIFFSYKKLKFIDFSELEIFWTILPGIVLFIISLPSLKLLYYLDLSKKKKPKYKIKVIGRQWYWKYGFMNNNIDYNFDRYMINLKKLIIGDFRLLEVDIPLFLPSMNFIRLIVSSNDVIHSFSIKSLGLKIDAVPGRFNFGYFYSFLYGRFYGQCSEICGVNHSFMPINIEIIKKYLVYK